MTAKRGTLWKTSWRRQKPGIGTAPQQMWFFRNFGDGPDESWFEQPLSTPATGDVAPPFWVGAIFGSVVIANPSPPPVSAALDTRVAFGLGTPLPGVPSWRSEMTSGGGGGTLLLNSRAQTAAFPFTPPNLDQTLTPLGSRLAPVILRAVVQMLVVEPLGGGGYQQSLWIDGTLRQTETTDPGDVYTVVPGAKLFVLPGIGFWNSMAGGNALPTTQEIQDWFSNSRYASPFPSAQEIPGKTLDRYDAADTPGLVPAALTNLAGGQAAVLTTSGTPPTPANLLVDATFGY